MISRAGWFLIACAACGGKKDAPPAPTTGSGSGSAVETVRLFSEQEIAGFEADLMQRLAANAKRTCPGPQVSEQPMPGPSSAVVGSLVEGSGVLADCGTKLGELAKGDLRAAVLAKAPEVVAFDAACGETLAQAVALAAAHSDGCSPFVVGVQAEPKESIRALQVAQVLAFHGRALATAGKTAEAIALHVHALRAFQDLGRGRITMLTAMLSAASLEVIGASLDGVLDTAKLDAAHQTALASQLDALIGAMPRFGEVMAGEFDNMAIYFGAAQLEPKGWTPPGGWNEEMHPKDGGDSAFPTEHFGDPRDEAAALLTMTSEISLEMTKACPEAASYAECTAAMVKLAAQTKPSPSQDLKALYGDLAKKVATGTVDVAAVRKEIRVAITNVLRSVAQPSFEKYPVKLALAVARLAELRLHVEVMRSGSCPTAAQLAAAPYAALAAPPVLGDSLALSVTKGQVQVDQPAWSEKSKVWTFHCK